MASTEGSGFCCNAAIALSRRSLRVRRIASHRVSPGSIWNGISTPAVAEICYGSAIEEELLTVSFFESIDLLRGVGDLCYFLGDEALKYCGLAVLYLLGYWCGLSLKVRRLTLNTGQLGSIAGLRRLQRSNVLIDKLRVLFDKCVNAFVDVFVR